RCTVSGSRVTGSSWKAATFRDVRFENGKADHALFRECKFYGVAFEDVPMHGADFQKSDMHNVRFENCTLTDVGGAASLRGVVVQGPGSMELALS
ncbi:pentapeptide repeat-containing protein, partial [Streptomyces sp. DT225]